MQAEVHALRRTHLQQEITCAPGVIRGLYEHYISVRDLEPLVEEAVAPHGERVSLVREKGVRSFPQAPFALRNFYRIPLRSTEEGTRRTLRLIYLVTRASVIKKISLSDYDAIREEEEMESTGNVGVNNADIDFFCEGFCAEAARVVSRALGRKQEAWLSDFAVAAMRFDAHRTDPDSLIRTTLPALLRLQQAAPNRYCMAGVEKCIAGVLRSVHENVVDTLEEGLTNSAEILSPVTPKEGGAKPLAFPTFCAPKFLSFDERDARGMLSPPGKPSGPQYFHTPTQTPQKGRTFFESGEIDREMQAMRGSLVSKQTPQKGTPQRAKRGRDGIKYPNIMSPKNAEDESQNKLQNELKHIIDCLHTARGDATPAPPAPSSVFTLDVAAKSPGQERRAKEQEALLLSKSFEFDETNSERLSQKGPLELEEEGDEGEEEDSQCSPQLLASMEKTLCGHEARLKEIGLEKKDFLVKLTEEEADSEDGKGEGEGAGGGGGGGEASQEVDSQHTTEGGDFFDTFAAIYNSRSKMGATELKDALVKMAQCLEEDNDQDEDSHSEASGAHRSPGKRRKVA